MQKCLGNVCMDMLFVKAGDKVEIIKDIEYIKKIAKHLDTISYEVFVPLVKEYLDFI